MDDFQDRGEPYRQVFGIDGTAGDAQDVPHPFVPDSPGGPCVVCGLARSYRKHTEDWIDGRAMAVDECGPLSPCGRAGHVDALDHGPGEESVKAARQPWGSYGSGRRLRGLYGLKGRITLDPPGTTANR